LLQLKASQKRSFQGSELEAEVMKILRLISSLSLLLGLGQFAARAAGTDTVVTLTNADDIHRLSREAASQNYPVRLTGVVTYSDVQWNVLFVQDASAGVFISLAVGNYPTNTEFVEIIGHTEEGSFLPVVAGASWRHLGVAPLPEPRRIIQPERFAGEIDSGWSEMVGVVRRVGLNAERNHLQLEVANGQWSARVFLPAPEGQYPKVLDDLIDAKISVVGVGGVEDVSPRNGISLKCFVPHSGLIRMLEPASTEPPATLPLSRVISVSVTNPPTHRVHVRGLATYLKPPNELVIQEDNSAVRVVVTDTGQLKVGDAVEVVGFIGRGAFTPFVEEAEIRPVTAKLRADPIAIAPATVLWGNYDARLVCLTGILQNHEITETNHVLTLLQDGVLFGASLNSGTATGDWSKLKKGDRVQVTGICAVQGAGRGAPQSFQVLLRSASDAAYLSGVRVFSAQQVLMVAGVAAAGLGIVLLWSVVLRRRVREQTAELARSLSLLNATIESTADGLLVVDRNGRVTSYNTTFTRMWHLPKEVVESKDERKLLDFVVAQLKDGKEFRSRVQEVYANPEAESFETLEFKDGRIFERVSQPQRLDGRCIGRVWCFRDVTERKQAEAQLAAVNHQLLETSRRVGMAEVATAVLHNVGNVLNSVNVSATLVNERLRRSRANNLAQAANLIETRMDDLDVFLAEDPKGKKLRAYLKELSASLVRDNDETRTEVESLRRNIEHIKTIVAMQQSYAQVSGTLEKLDPRELMENALQINRAAYERDHIQVSRDYQAAPQVLVDRHKVLQILINLLSNARHALEQSAPQERWVNLSIFPVGSERVCLRVGDNGAGIEAQNLSKIFSQGFTTRKDGHGFGLHSGANAANEMNGALSVHSDGPAKGAIFTLELPITKDSN
jgi:PAS domain S-box-containing protein